MTLTLTVDAEKGDSARAVLQIVNSAVEWIVYLLLFVIILAILLLITWIIICNIFMPRIKPGVLYFYDLKLNALSQYYISSYDSKRLRNLPRLKLTLKPQKCRNFCGVDFVAKGEACSLPFQTYMPGALLQGRNAALEPYTMAGSNPARTEFLELLYNGGGDVRRMRKANVNYLIPTMSVIDRARNADQETEYLPPMENGGFLVFRCRNGEGQLDGLKIWTFVPD